MFDFFITVVGFLTAIFILVVVHEYGHYITARLFKVKVLQFSIGFGPNIISKTNKNGTKFSLSLIPLGGYVRMLGEDNKLSNSQDSFSNKKPWQKILIVLAGPIFNFILAFIVFFLMYMIGINVARPVIQYIEPNSKAAQAGVSVNQEIKKIDSYVINSIEDVQVALANRLGEKGDLELHTIDFNNTNGQFIKDYSYKLNINNWDVDINKEPLSNSLGIWMVPKNDFALLVYDILDQNKLSENFIINYNADLSDLIKGDIITSINQNKEFKTYDEFLKFIKANPGKELLVTVLRNGEYKNFTIKLGSKSVQSIKEPSDDEVYAQGFLGIAFKYPMYFSIQNYDFINSIYKAYHRTVSYIYQSFYMIYKLIIGDIGIETIRGPVMVAKAAGIQIQLGISHFLNLLGVISIGLGIINILPIPVLDGGHALIHSYELFFKKPVSEQTQKYAMIFGLCLIGLLMSVALYNDLIYWN